MILSEPQLIETKVVNDINNGKIVDKVVLYCQCPLPMINPDGKTGNGHLVNRDDAKHGIKCSKCGQVMIYSNPFGG